MEEVEEDRSRRKREWKREWKRWSGVGGGSEAWKRCTRMRKKKRMSKWK